jgi:hypothetical protein
VSTNGLVDTKQEPGAPKEPSADPETSGSRTEVRTTLCWREVDSNHQYLEDKRPEFARPSAGGRWIRTLGPPVKKKPERGRKTRFLNSGRSASRRSLHDASRLLHLTSAWGWRRSQHLQPSTPPRLALDAAGLPAEVANQWRERSDRPDRASGMRLVFAHHGLS